MSEMTLAAPLSGWLMSLRDVPDPVFSQGMMGDGFAIDPIDGKVTSPCAATVLQVAATQHSVTLRTEDGAELLIHVGLETVALAGAGFEALVAKGVSVAAGDPLIAFDIDLVGEQARSLITPVILTNGERFTLSVPEFETIVTAGDAVASLAGHGADKESSVSSLESASAEAVVGFEHGLHARPAARVADAAKRFASQVEISARGKAANARSAVAIMALDVRGGDRVAVTATGVDRDEAIRSVVAVLQTVEKPAVPERAAPTLPSGDGITGICAVPGAAVGVAYRLRRVEAQIAEGGRGVEHERGALADAVAQVCDRLKETAARLEGPGSEVTSAHVSILEDEDLRNAADAEIEKGSSAAHAWITATAAADEDLHATGNPRMRERVADLQDVSAQVVAALTGAKDRRATEIPEHAIVLAEDLLPSEILSLDRSRVAGIAVERGGPTSHMAIIAASLGLPTVVAIGPSLSQVKNGQRILLDASRGRLIPEPSDSDIERASANSRYADGAGSATTDRGPITLLVNLGAVSEVAPALEAGAEGCGLLRTEFLFLDRSEAPTIEEQAQTYQQIADALGGNPLTIRTLDIGGDKPVPFIKFGHEENPALGARGVRMRLVDPELIDNQLRAIAQVRSDALKVMIPMVSSVDELREVRGRLEALSAGHIKLGAMVETPAAALIADKLAAEADFLSIGTNDLAQYVLAMDRTSDLLAPQVDALHPAVLRLIAMTVEAGKGRGIPVSVCGNLAFDPIGARLLVGLGISELSGAAALLSMVRHSLSQTSAADCRALAQQALQLESAAEVRALAAEIEGARA